jgi:hypothetical protein
MEVRAMARQVFYQVRNVEGAILETLLTRAAAESRVTSLLQSVGETEVHKSEWMSTLDVQRFAPDTWRWRGAHTNIVLTIHEV